MARRLRRARAAGGAAGFTLIEVIVALVLVGIAAAALVPVLVVSARAVQVTKLNTVAKNLNQLRLDAMRNLPYHVDVQNGDYVDLLDNYYVDLATTPRTLPFGVASGAASCTVTGQWVQSGTGAGGAPTGPYYAVTFTPVCGLSAGAQTVPATAGLTQTVYAQFLTGASGAPTAMPASALLAAGYDSQAEGRDAPPSLLLGVTVVTTWSQQGVSKSFRTQTQITDNGTGTALILSQARATGLLVRSHAEDGSALEAAAGTVALDGNLAATSSASAVAEAAHLTQAGGPGVTGATASAVAPPDPAGSTGVGPLSPQQQVGTSTPCGWGSLGPSQVGDVSATAAGGLPQAPSDAGSGAAPPPRVTAGLLANGGGTCSGLTFTNRLDPTVGTDPALQLGATAPMVQVVDTTGSGSELGVAASVAATAAVGTPGAVTATAQLSSTTSVSLFPGLPFVPTGASTCGSGTQPCGPGLVNVFLTDASLTCSSGAATESASYHGYLTYYTETGWHSVPLSWTSGSGGTDPLIAVDLGQPVTTYAGSPVPLSAYVNAWSTATGTDGGGTAAPTTLGPVVSLTTAPTRVGDPGSQLGLEIGRLSCLAVDAR